MGADWSDLDSLGFFEAAILYIFGHIPTNAYAILAAIVQQEFKHPKFKHPSGIPNYPVPFETLHTIQRLAEISVSLRAGCALRVSDGTNQVQVPSIPS